MPGTHGGDDLRPELRRRRVPTRVPQVLANTSFVMSMAMSQRTPSHASPIRIRVSAVARRVAAANASSCTTSGQGGK